MNPEDALEAVPAERAAAMMCPILSSSPDAVGIRFCVGPLCMAWRPVRTGPQEFSGYCGIAGTPLGFSAHMQRQVMSDVHRSVFGAANDS